MRWIFFWLSDCLWGQFQAGMCYMLWEIVCLWEIKPLQRVWNRLERRGEDEGNTEQRLRDRNKLAIFWEWLRWRRRLKEVMTLKLKGGGDKRRMRTSRRGPGIWWNETGWRRGLLVGWEAHYRVAGQEELTGKRPSGGGRGHPATPWCQGDWNGRRKSKSILSHCAWPLERREALMNPQAQGHSFPEINGSHI